MIARLLRLTLCAGLACAETPAQKAWGIPTSASQDKNYEKRMAAVSDHLD